jgi:hypothetical protein
VPTPKQRDKADHLIRILEGLRRHEPWPPATGDVADVCRRCFELTESLASDLGTSMAVCFLPSFEAESAPEALCCQCVKAIADLHSAAGIAGTPAGDSRARAQAAIDRLVEGLQGLTARASSGTKQRPSGTKRVAE